MTIVKYDIKQSTNFIYFYTMLTIWNLASSTQIENIKILQLKETIIHSYHFFIINSLLCSFIIILNRNQ